MHVYMWASVNVCTSTKESPAGVLCKRWSVHVTIWIWRTCIWSGHMRWRQRRRRRRVPGSQVDDIMLLFSAIKSFARTPLKHAWMDARRPSIYKVSAYECRDREWARIYIICVFHMCGCVHLRSDQKCEPLVPAREWFIGEAVRRLRVVWSFEFNHFCWVSCVQCLCCVEQMMTQMVSVQYKLTLVSIYQKH